MLDSLLKSILISSLLISPSIMAAQLQPIDQMQTVAKEFVISQLTTSDSDKVNVDVKAIDVELPKCQQALSAAFPPNTLPEQATGVEVSCNDNPAWKMLLPVTIQVFTNVVVAKQVIPAGEALTAENITVEQYDKNRLYNGYFKNVNEVFGNNAAHTISAGTIITQKTIQPPTVIHRGEKVNVTVKKQSIVLNMEGIAKSDGALNSTIEVYNPSSKRIIDAIVIGPTQAQVTL